MNSGSRHPGIKKNFKYLIIFLVLVSIATVSCKKNSPVEPEPTPVLYYRIVAEIRGSIPIYYEGWLLEEGEEPVPIWGTTPADFLSYGPDTLVIGAGIYKTESAGILSITLRNQANNKVLDYAETAKAYVTISVWFP